MGNEAAALVSVLVIAVLLTIIILLGGSQLIHYMNKKRTPERYGRGETGGGISSIDSLWFK